MPIFITGTDTDVGKTCISAWLCAHSGWDYFKPIQTGTRTDPGGDRAQVAQWAGVNCWDNYYAFSEPLSPHACAAQENRPISMEALVQACPKTHSVIVEGAGGVLVPLTPAHHFAHLLAIWQIPTVVVARSTLGTINHTCLTLQCLRQHGIPILGVILNGPPNPGNAQAIAHYGQTTILAEFPVLPALNTDTLRAVPLSPSLAQALSPSGT